MVEFDVIMGMDWLASCYASVDCRLKMVQFQFPGEPVLKWKGNTVSPRGKANVVADALSHRSMGSLSYLQPEKSEIACGTRVTIQDTATSSLVTEVKERQYEDPVLDHYRDTTPQKVMGEAHYSRNSIRPGATKMYHDIRGIYWWNGMKKDIVEFVTQFPNSQQVKIEYQKPDGLL
ncbi:uncharacterized protein [Nicotiana tomentosiformis]|uniref:uncharacterized protein n=1 Tax=Nicotiana tomentosiformis TaxID=4098 RepID=UPI00388C43C2